MSEYEYEPLVWLVFDGEPGQRALGAPYVPDRGEIVVLSGREFRVVDRKWLVEPQNNPCGLEVTVYLEPVDE